MRPWCMTALVLTFGCDDPCSPGGVEEVYEATVPRHAFQDLVGDDDILSDAECFDACVPDDVEVSEEISCDHIILDRRRSAGGQLVTRFSCRVRTEDACE